jgi:hypothetical protein
MWKVFHSNEGGVNAIAERCLKNWKIFDNQLSGSLRNMKLRRRDP